MESGCIGILPIIFESPGPCTFHIAHFAPALMKTGSSAVCGDVDTPRYILKTPRCPFWISLPSWSAAGKTPQSESALTPAVVRLGKSFRTRVLSPSIGRYRCRRLHDQVFNEEFHHAIGVQAAVSTIWPHLEVKALPCLLQFTDELHHVRGMYVVVGRA